MLNAIQEATLHLPHYFRLVDDPSRRAKRIISYWQSLSSTNLFCLNISQAKFVRLHSICFRTFPVAPSLTLRRFSRFYLALGGSCLHGIQHAVRNIGLCMAPKLYSSHWLSKE